MAALPRGHQPRQQDAWISRADPKIVANLELPGATRFDLEYGMGGLSHETLMTNIELYRTEVIPRVRELARTKATALVYRDLRNTRLPARPRRAGPRPTGMLVP